MRGPGGGHRQRDRRSTSGVRFTQRSSSMAATAQLAKSKVEPDGHADFRKHYGCGPVAFAGEDNALFERHLLFDSVVAESAAGAREKFEAFARSVRDVLSQRWVLTE